MNLARHPSILHAITWSSNMSRTGVVGITLILAASTTAWGQYGSAVNTVTVNVDPIVQIRVIGGAVGFNINDATAVAGQNSMLMVNTATQLQWATNSGTQKITAQTSLGSPMFALRLVAATPTAGTTAPETVLSTIATDLVLNVGRSLGTCTLQYTAEALATQGTGSDIHTITFTVTTQ